MADLDSLTLDPKRVRMLALVLFTSAILAFIGAVHLFMIRDATNTIHTIIVAGEVILGFIFLIVAYLFRGVAGRIEKRETARASSEKALEESEQAGKTEEDTEETDTNDSSKETEESKE